MSFLDENVIKALWDTGTQAAILYKSVFEETKNEQIAKNIVHEFFSVLLKPDSNKFFM